MAHAATLALVAGAFTVLCCSANALAETTANPLPPVQQGEAQDRHEASGPGTAHAISLSTQLGSNLSDAEREEIRRLGPWLTDDGISVNAQSLVRSIQEAGIHGLDPESYGLSKILDILDLLEFLDQQTSLPPETLSYDLPAARRTLRYQLNAILDTSFVRLATHLGEGVVDPAQLRGKHYHEARAVNAFNLLVSISSADLSVTRALNEVTPSHPAYARLNETMRNLLTELSTGVTRTRVGTEPVEKEMGLIMHARDRQIILQRLRETGDLQDISGTAVYSADGLGPALLAFQERHGLELTGTADRQTRAALNTSVEQDIAAVALSLERWRWLPRDFGQRHIFVNIPAYQVQLFDHGSVSLEMDAIVGRIENQTPAFSKDMSYIEFNPTWTVPANLANTRLLPLERKTPGYLVSQGFDFFRYVNNQLVPVSADEVTRDDFKAPRFPYTLRQRSGPMNALGRMKFMMPNPYAIYLHDTPTKSLFGLNERAYSQGCIRLSEPDELARHLMLGDGYSEDRLDQSLQSGRTHRIDLRSPVPTHLVYLTTWVDETGLLQSRDDIYDQNDSLTDALQAAGTLLTRIEVDGRTADQQRLTDFGYQ